MTQNTAMQACVAIAATFGVGSHSTAAWGQAAAPVRPPTTSPTVRTASVRTATTAPSATATEAASLDELSRELAELQAADTNPPLPPPPPLSAAPVPNTWARGLSNIFNPAMSATATLLVGVTTREEEDDEEGAEGEDHGHGGGLGTGFTLQEVELRFSSIVDPYLRADIRLGGSLEGISFEEAFVSTLHIPQVTLRAGLLLANFGKHNFLHTHNFPFLTAPLPVTGLLGDEGLRGPGLSADVLLPLPFYAEFNAQVFQGEWELLEGSIADDPATMGDESQPDQRRDSDFGYLGHLKTLFELGAATTVELGGSYAAGRNGYAALAQVLGADLSLKWRPIEAERYTGLDWITEFIWVDQKGAEDRRRAGGYTAVRYQFSQIWWVQARAAVLNFSNDEGQRSVRAEGLLALVPSEFSALRLQYAHERGPQGSDSVHELFLQLVVSIGSHPAHAY